MCYNSNNQNSINKELNSSNIKYLIENIINSLNYKNIKAAKIDLKINFINSNGDINFTNTNESNNHCNLSIDFDNKDDYNNSKIFEGRKNKLASNDFRSNNLLDNDEVLPLIDDNNYLPLN